jgi:hypothetical protein
MVEKKRSRYLWLLLPAATVGAVAMAAWWRLAAAKTAEDEAHAVAALRMYLDAQNRFHREDRYGKGLLVYANPTDGKGFPDLYQIGGPGSGGKVLDLIPEAMARATVGGTPWGGYVFADIECGDYSIDCGLMAIPVAAGRREFGIDVTGPIYSASPRSGDPDEDMPPTHFPIGGWVPVGPPGDR